MEEIRESSKTKAKRVFFFILGTLSLILGIIGVFLPLLPTTPFILLSAACYLRSSRKMYEYVTQHELFGEYIRNYEKGVMKKSDRFRTLIILWIGVILSSIIIAKTIVAIILFLIAIGVTIHLSLLKGI